jgi:hypothetical protein
VVKKGSKLIASAFGILGGSVSREFKVRPLLPLKRGKAGEQPPCHFSHQQGRVLCCCRSVVGNHDSAGYIGGQKFSRHLKDRVCSSSFDEQYTSGLSRVLYDPVADSSSVSNDATTQRRINEPEAQCVHDYEALEALLP